MRRTARGMTLIEFALLLVIVVAGGTAMAIFLKRGYMGRLRDASDQVGEQFTPLSYVANYNRTVDVERREVTTTTGAMATNLVRENQNRSGQEDVLANLTDENLY